MGQISSSLKLAIEHTSSDITCLKSVSIPSLILIYNTYIAENIDPNPSLLYMYILNRGPCAYS